MLNWIGKLLRAADLGNRRPLTEVWRRRFEAPGGF